MRAQRKNASDRTWTATAAGFGEKRLFIQINPRRATCISAYPANEMAFNMAHALSSRRSREKKGRTRSFRSRLETGRKGLRTERRGEGVKGGLGLILFGEFLSCFEMKASSYWF